MTGTHVLSDEMIDAAITTACQAIAPTWPLDQLVAINPLWQLTGRPIQEAAVQVAVRGGARALPDRHYFAEQWRAGRIARADLGLACDESGMDVNVKQLIAHLDVGESPGQLCLMIDQLDRERDLGHQTAWREEVVHQISQLCAAELDLGLGDWPTDHDDELYRAWLYNVCRDRGIAIVMGVPGLQKHFRDLPGDADALIKAALVDMEVPAASVEAYLHALLLRVNGWASWCAYLSRQAQQQGDTDDTLRQLLAIRLAWDWVLYKHVADRTQQLSWQARLHEAPQLEAEHDRDQELDWIWQRALELGYERGVVDALTMPPGSANEAAGRTSQTDPEFQVAFCIDVRSEVYRRALETAGGRDVQTLGFAGFFGVPIAYRPHGIDVRQNRLPGPLAPSLSAVECESHHHGQQSDQLGAVARLRLRSAELIRRFRWGATSMFSYVESMGLFYAGKMLADGLLKHHHAEPVNGLHPVERASLSPELRAGDETSLPTAQRVALAATILRGLSLIERFASVVALVGHTSETRNNPQASALDCGACGGRAGDVNARLVADLLNDADVRVGLKDQGIHIPDETCFVAGLHNTTTDAVTLFQSDEVMQHHADRIDRLRAMFEAAQQQTSHERFPHLERVSPSSGRDAPLANRAQDWSELRPEWGLAGNASLVIAPRRRTRGVNLEGRAFLHEYDPAHDTDHSVLESILTAPMVVAHWINFQYYASTVDNRFYGSGNKTLHNVVGGHIGLFEGNGGDLRIGLALQSLHDGEHWVHEPLRMSVFVQASIEAIDRILVENQTIRNLVDNQWLFVYAIGEAGEPVQLRHANGWQRSPCKVRCQ